MTKDLLELGLIMKALTVAQETLLKCRERFSDLESENAELKRRIDCLLEVMEAKRAA